MLVEIAAVDLLGLVDTLLRDLLIAGLALGAAFSICCLVLSVVAYRRIRRLAPVKRSLLAVRSAALPPGPARTLANLRRDLDRSVRSTRDCVDRARARGQRVNDLPASVGHLAKAARLLDDHLRDLEHELDAARQAAQLPGARDRVAQLVAAAATVRDAVCATTAVVGDAQLRALASDVDRQALRLSAYGSAYRELQDNLDTHLPPLSAPSARS